MYRTLERLQGDPERGACARFLAGRSSLHRHEILNTLAFDRLRYKMELVRTLHSECGEDWYATIYRLYFRTLGDIRNRKAFLTLAERVPFRVIQKEPQQVEALLLGASGLLKRYRYDDYTLQLLRDYEFLAHKYDLQAMEASEWTLTGIRPANHPLLRIVQAARFFAQPQSPLDTVKACRTPRDIRQRLGVEAPDYWNTHYTPDAAQERHPKRIGQEKADMLGINFVAVVLYAYGSYMYDESLLEQAQQLWEAIEPENNAVVRAWCNAGVPAPANAY